MADPPTPVPDYHTWGMAAALTAAMLWAMATYVYRSAGTQISPLRLNFLKGVIASVVLAAIFVWQGNLLPPLPAKIYFWLLISGVIGIGVGDTAFFAALNRLGARQSVLLFEAMAPLMTLGLSMVFIGTQMPGSTFAGTLTVLIGVAIAMSDRKYARKDEILSFRGVLYATIAALCQAIGAVLSKLVFVAVEVSPVWSAMVRIVASTLFLAPLAWYASGRSKPLDARLTQMIVAATLLGTIIGISLLQSAFKYTYAATAQALAGTVSLFVLAFGVPLGHRVGVQAWLGTVVAVAGVFWLFLGDEIWSRIAS